VLNQVTLEIYSGQKIGIIGPTGAGKSTLALALFRLVQPTSGCILIDNVDISKIGLNTLRRNLSIVPQEPVLFSTTLRKNIDPFNKHSNNEIIQYLQLVGLDHIVQNNELDVSIEKVVSTLSTGQKQLLCVVRALLRRPTILVLDDVTASLDMQTTRVIQSVLKKIDCTVIIIAHFLETVMDCDKVVVLEDGSVVEFDCPQSLLSNPLVGNGQKSRFI